MADAPSRVTALCDCVGLRPGDTLLDLGCGVGRKVLAATQRGLVVAGIEYSAELGTRARERLHAAGAVADIRQGDVRRLPQMDLGPFGVGWFLDSALQVFRAPAFLRVLSDLRARIRPAGRVLVEALNPAWWQHQTEAQVFCSPSIGPGPTTRRYRLDTKAGRLTDSVTRTPDTGAQPSQFSLEFRLLSADRLQGLVEDTGFASVTILGTRAAPGCPLPLADAPTLLALGHRPELSC